MNGTIGTLVLAAVLLPGTAAAQLRLTDPGLPPLEGLEYSETIGQSSHPWTTALKLVRIGDVDRYEFRSEAPELVSTYWIAPDTLISMASQTVTRSTEATVTRTAAYENLRLQAAADEVLVTDLGSLPLVLRGYPWGKEKMAKILFLGNSNSAGVPFELRVVGRETVLAAGRRWDCWHATTGLGGAFSLLVPKTDWWFSAEGSHPLIKMTGLSAGPGSPARTLVLQKVSPDPAVRP